MLRSAAALAGAQAAAPLCLLASPARLVQGDSSRGPGPAPCLQSSRSHYPPLLQRFIDKLDPAADVFPTEVYVRQLETLLSGWSKALRQDGAGSGSGPSEAFARLVAQKVLASPAVPAHTAVLRSGPPLRVERCEFTAAQPISREAFVRQQHDQLSVFKQIDVAEFEVYGIRVLGESPLRIETEIHYDIVGDSTSAKREQRNGTWAITWSRSGAGSWQAERWTQNTETRATLTGPGFADVTGNVLSVDSPAAKQLAVGIDHWRGVLDAAAGLDVYGNHGVAAGDIDGSGLDSIYVCQPSGLPNRLLRNRHDGTFEDITDLSGTGLLDGTASAIFADFRNRGRQDLLVVRSGGPLLMENMGDGRFEPRPDAFHFARPPQGTLTSAAVADYNRDGLLDVYFCVYSYYQGLDQYQFPSPYYDAQNGPPNFLFRNRGDGTFEDVTAVSGMDMNNNRFSFAAEWCDYDGNGWPDLYVANDFGRKNLYRNDGRGRFTDVAAQAGVEDYGPGMSTCWLDYDRDGKPDLYVANMWLREGKRITANERFLPDAPGAVRALYQKHNAGNSMYRNGGAGHFEDRTQAAGTERGGWSWSCAAWDADSDGWPDLYVANGFVSGADRFDLQSFFWRQVAQRSAAPPGVSTEYEMAWNAVNELVRSDYSWSGYQRNVFYANNGDGTFSDVSGAMGLDLFDDSRAFALSDLDGDGELEFVLKNRTAPQLRVMRNGMQHGGNKLAVRLRGTRSNRDAIGAVVTVESSGVRQVQELSAGSGFASQHTKELFFGLGAATAPANVTVRWPAGGTDSYPAVAVNRRVLLEEGNPDSQGQAFTVRRDQPVTPASLPPISSPAILKTWLAAPLLGPELVLKASDGVSRSLRALRGAPVALVFLDLACEGASAAQLALLTAAKDKMQKAGLRLFAAAVTRSDAAATASQAQVLPATEAQLQAWNIQYRYLFDRRRDLGFPTTFLLDAAGAAVCVYQGLITPDELIADSKSIPATANARLAKALPYPGPYFGNPLTRDYFTYAVAFVEYGLLDEAEAALREALRVNPLYASAWFNLGTVLLNKKEYPEAQKALAEAARLNPQDSDAWNNLGMIAGEQGSYDEALLDFTKSARTNPNHLTAVENMMKIYQFQGRAADAQAAMQELVAKAPGNADLHLGLAMALLGQDDVPGAERELHKAIELRPNFADAINNLGTVLLRAGDTAGALAEFERCRRIAPEFDRPVLNEAMMYSRGGDAAKARALLQGFLQQHPDNADVRALLTKLGGA